MSIYIIDTHIVLISFICLYEKIIYYSLYIRIENLCTGREQVHNIIYFYISNKLSIIYSTIKDIILNRDYFIHRHLKIINSL